jgi:NAD(P)H-dependent flavin oxidoreductase YrpB (nitropropane dioxygenase family)
MKNKLQDLKIGNIVINPPIIQGGMGVRISKSSLASAVSNTGALGVIASVGLGDEKASEKDYINSSKEALRKEIKKAKKLTKGYLGVNIMIALTNYNSLAKVCVDEGVDIIFSGAGLPIKLPEFLINSDVKFVPIISSPRAIEIICKSWLKRYGKVPDAFVLEGPDAGGHLGFSLEELQATEKDTLEKLFISAKQIVKKFENISKKHIPIILAGGIFTGQDIAKYLKLGADGVQMATRFVCTKECDAHLNYKKQFLNAKKEDIILIKSPVGLMGRVIKNNFVERICNGEKIDFDCHYQCLKHCDSKKVHYCIADALTNASRGNFEMGFAMCGLNAYRINKIVSVNQLIRDLTEEALSSFT